MEKMECYNPDVMVEGVVVQDDSCVYGCTGGSKKYRDQE